MDLWFPPACRACEGALPDERDKRPLCDACLKRLPLIDGPACQRCGAPIAAVGTAGLTCPRCAKEGFRFDRAVALGLYQGDWRELVLRTKNRHETALTLGLGQLLADRVTATTGLATPDVVVPIPMHWIRRLKRGVNGAELLAECLAGRLRVPLANRLLRRRRNTPPQSFLPRSDRPQNVRDAFVKRVGYHLKAAHVLLVDDILTTGSTCSEAARALKREGAAAVTVAVLARGVGAT